MMRKSKLIALSVLALFTAGSLLSGCGSSTSKATTEKKEIVLKAVDVQPEDYPT